MAIFQCHLFLNLPQASRGTRDDKWEGSVIVGALEGLRPSFSAQVRSHGKPGQVANLGYRPEPWSAVHASLRLELGEDLELGDVVEHYEGGEDQ